MNRFVKWDENINFAHEKQEQATIKHMGRASLIGILINKKIETEKVSFANGGPYKTLNGTKLQSRWITKAESSQILYTRSFFTSLGDPFTK